ncbi:MAG TPA: endolytic transglycosylase MltG [Terriglobales bacterium]|nr:endolytic transglycosylase MltG [Terriglobales bacterium]
MRKLLTFFLLAALALGAWLAWGLLLPVTPSGQKFVMLRSGYTTRRIANELRSAGVIRSERAFLLWHSFHRKASLKAGEYLFEKPATLIEVHHRLARGDIYTHTVVIPEGYTMFDIAQTIEQAGLGSKDDFLKVARSDTDLIHDLAPEATTLEGYLFPDTYELTRTQSMSDIATVMVHHFRQEAASLGLASDIHRTVTMASIVEKETAAPQERPQVASVYYNRLAKHMALDADPSVIYAELLMNTYRGALHHDDMQTKSPYNTYRYPGLPPGPIANPGRGSIEAAMHPVVSDYLYFVSDGNGHHRFACSLEEHNRNVVAFRHALQHRP